MKSWFVGSLYVILFMFLFCKDNEGKSDPLAKHFNCNYSLHDLHVGTVRFNVPGTDVSGLTDAGIVETSWAELLFRSYGRKNK